MKRKSFWLWRKDGTATATAVDDDALTMAMSFELYWFVSSIH